MQGRGSVMPVSSADIDGRRQREEKFEDIEAAISRGDHKRSAVLEEHPVGALLAAVPEADLINGRGVAVERSPEGADIVVRRELEKARGRVVGLHGEVVHSFASKPATSAAAAVELLFLRG